MGRLAERVQAYVEHLERLPFVERAGVEPTTQPIIDGTLRLTTPAGDTVLPFELKRTHLTREMAERLVHLAGQHPGLVVMAPAIGRELGELFARNHVHFVDLAGNCFLQIADRYVARIQGQRAQARPPAEKALRTPAYRVLFALLVDPELLHATARVLAEAAGGVSPQTANDVRARLLAAGILLQTRGGVRWAPGQRKRALDLFLVGFPALMPGFVLGRYRAKQRTPEELEADLAPRLTAVGEWRWGGGAGARRLTGFYRGDRTIVYLRDPDLVALRALPLVPDAAGPVTLARIPGPLAFEGPNAEVVHPLLVYADLLAEGNERAREAAAEIHRRYLEEAAT